MQIHTNFSTIPKVEDLHLPVEKEISITKIWHMQLFLRDVLPTVNVAPQNRTASLLFQPNQSEQYIHNKI